MQNAISKSRFKARALEFFRQVEQTGESLVITNRGTPVLKLIPFREDPLTHLKLLRDTVVRYNAPTEPVADAEWDSVE